MGGTAFGRSVNTTFCRVRMGVPTSMGGSNVGALRSETRIVALTPVSGFFVALGR
jgi:hypothetical protein